MVEMTTTIQYEGALGMLRRTERVLADGERLVEAAGEAMQLHAERVFETEGAATGRPWRRHSPATIRRHGPSRILDRTGGLKRSYTRRSGMNRFDVAGPSIRFGSSHPLAHLHQRTRPVLEWPSDAERNRELAVAIASEIGDVIRGR